MRTQDLLHLEYSYELLRAFSLDDLLISLKVVLSYHQQHDNHAFCKKEVEHSVCSYCNWSSLIVYDLREFYTALSRVNFQIYYGRNFGSYD
jgi:hypothetical protein